MSLHKLGAPPFLSINEVENDMIVTIVREPFVVSLENSKWGKARGRVTIKLPNGEERRWTMNVTTWDRLIDDYGAEPSMWMNKKIRLKKVRMVINGEYKPVLYGVPYREPQKPLAEY